VNTTQLVYQLSRNVSMLTVGNPKIIKGMEKGFVYGGPFFSSGLGIWSQHLC